MALPTFHNLVKSKGSYGGAESSSYDKILAIFNTGDGSNSVLSRTYQTQVALKTAANYEYVLGIMSSGEYQYSAGCDLSAIFMPYQSVIKNATMPSFYYGASTTSAAASGNEPNNVDLMPFQWNNKRGDVVLDRWLAVSGDAIKALVSDDVYRGNVDEYRDISNERGVGFRLPMMGVGWGYTLEGDPWPSGNKVQNKKTFKGDYTNGWQVNPKDYVAAPIDLRYDRERHVWTINGDNGLYARITDHVLVPGPNGGDFRPAYSWIEQLVTSSGTFESKPNGQTGTYSAYDINDNMAENGLVVRLRKAISSATEETGSVAGEEIYLFNIETIPVGIKRYQVYTMVSDNVAGWDYSRFHQ